MYHLFINLMNPITLFQHFQRAEKHRMNFLKKFVINSRKFIICSDFSFNFFLFNSMRHNLKIYTTEMFKPFYQKIILMEKDSIFYKNLTFGN